jgi:hypothetical protein
MSSNDRTGAGPRGGSPRGCALVPEVDCQVVPEAQATEIHLATLDRGHLFPEPALSNTTANATSPRLAAAQETEDPSTALSIVAPVALLVIILVVRIVVALLPSVPWIRLPAVAGLARIVRAHARA